MNTTNTNPQTNKDCDSQTFSIKDTLSESYIHLLNFVMNYVTDDFEVEINVHTQEVQIKPSQRWRQSPPAYVIISTQPKGYKLTWLTPNFRASGHSDMVVWEDDSTFKLLRKWIKDIKSLPIIVRK